MAVLGCKYKMKEGDWEKAGCMTVEALREAAERSPHLRPCFLVDWKWIETARYCPKCPHAILNDTPDK